MPLEKSASKEALQKNIHEMVRAGHKPSQAVAAALATQRMAKKQHMSEGGMVDASKGSPEMDTGAIMEKIRAHLSPEEHAHIAKFTQSESMAKPQEMGGFPTYPLDVAEESLSPNVDEAGDMAHGKHESGEDMSYSGFMKREGMQSSPSDSDNGVSRRSMQIQISKPQMNGAQPDPMTAGSTEQPMPPAPGSKEDAKSAIARRKAKAAQERASYRPRG